MPLTVQVPPEALRSRMVVQMVPAAPSLPWTDPRSAEASQRPVAGRPAVGGGVVGAVTSGGTGSGGWGAAGGPAAVERALQPVTATAATNTTAAMILTGRMAPPPKRHGPAWAWYELDLGRSRPDDGRASRPARNGLGPVKIVAPLGRQLRVNQPRAGCERVLTAGWSVRR
jgi:hypothetical protein